MDWRKFLMIATRHLDAPIETVKGEWTSDGGAPSLPSWCCWTTFDQLESFLHYWTAPLPDPSEIGERGTADGGTWGQPFYYEQLVHLVIPRHFQEAYPNHGQDGYLIADPERNLNGFWMWKHTQDINGLSELLQKESIDHRISQWALEVKLY